MVEAALSAARDEILNRLGADGTMPLPDPFPAEAKQFDFVHQATLLGVEFVCELPATGDTDLWEAEIFVSTALLAVAETGSVLLDATEPRLGSVLPPTHVVRVSRARIVNTLEEALSRLSGRSCVLITGPSRTADIEGVLVRGVHGPGRVLVFLEE